MCIYVVHLAPVEVKWLGNSEPFHDRKRSKQWCLREIAREGLIPACLVRYKREDGKRLLFKLGDKLHEDIYRAQSHSAV